MTIILGAYVPEKDRQYLMLLSDSLASASVRKGTLPITELTEKVWFTGNIASASAGEQSVFTSIQGDLELIHEGAKLSHIKQALDALPAEHIRNFESDITGVKGSISLVGGPTEAGNLALYVCSKDGKNIDIVRVKPRRIYSYGAGAVPAKALRRSDKHIDALIEMYGLFKEARSLYVDDNLQLVLQVASNGQVNTHALYPPKLDSGWLLWKGFTGADLGGFNSRFGDRANPQFELAGEISWYREFYHVFTSALAQAYVLTVSVQAADRYPKSMKNEAGGMSKIEAKLKLTRRTLEETVDVLASGSLERLQQTVKSYHNSFRT